MCPKASPLMLANLIIRCQTSPGSCRCLSRLPHGVIHGFVGSVDGLSVYVRLRIGDAERRHGAKGNGIHFHLVLVVPHAETGALRYASR